MHRPRTCAWGPSWRWIVAAGAVAAFATAACAGPATTAPGVPDTEPGATGANGGATGILVGPVSASKPAGAAAAVLERCGVTSDAATRVAGMAEIAAAADLPHYVPMTGREPVLRWDGPAWVVRLRGEVAMPKIGEVWIDPACIVVAGDDPSLSGFHAIGGWIDADGAMHAPLPPASEPDRPLPTLAP